MSSILSALRDKEKLAEALRPSSVVYHRRRRLPGPLNAQFQNFRLAPLTGLQDVAFELGDEKNKAGKALSELNAWSERQGTLRFQTNRPSTSVSLFYKRDFAVPHQLDSSSNLHLARRQTDNGSLITSNASTPLPEPRRREPTSVFLFRRPTIEKPISLSEEDELFIALTKSIDLKALPFKKQADSYKFYETHFPLILTGMSKEAERCNTPSRRSRTPESPMNILINRQRALNMRLIEQETLMQQLERETEDVEFVTELHNPIFNPTKWPWNKIDVGGLRRRYTIDASLRDM